MYVVFFVLFACSSACRQHYVSYPDIAGCVYNIPSSHGTPVSLYLHQNNISYSVSINTQYYNTINNTALSFREFSREFAIDDPALVSEFSPTNDRFCYYYRSYLTSLERGNDFKSFLSGIVDCILQFPKLKTKYVVSTYRHSGVNCAVRVSNVPMVCLNNCTDPIYC